MNEILSDIKLACTREAELGEPARAFGDGGIGPYDFAGDRYVRLRTLRKRLHRLNGPIAA